MNKKKTSGILLATLILATNNPLRAADAPLGGAGAPEIRSALEGIKASLAELNADFEARVRTVRGRQAEFESMASAFDGMGMHSRAAELRSTIESTNREIDGISASVLPAAKNLGALAETFAFVSGSPEEIYKAASATKSFFPSESFIAQVGSLTLKMKDVPAIKDMGTVEQRERLTKIATEFPSIMVKNAGTGDASKWWATEDAPKEVNDHVTSFLLALADIFRLETLEPVNQAKLLMVLSRKMDRLIAAA
jgi:hypothetical protein